MRCSEKLLQRAKSGQVFHLLTIYQILTFLTLHQRFKLFGRKRRRFQVHDPFFDAAQRGHVERLRRCAGADCGALTRRVCERQRGIGADGVEWLYPAAKADVEARLVNADGSAAEISGNGTRCVAAYLAWKNHVDQVDILTGAGLKRNKLKSREGNVFEFETAMGVPSWEGTTRLGSAGKGVGMGIGVWGLGSGIWKEY